MDRLVAPRSLMAGSLYLLERTGAGRQGTEQETDQALRDGTTARGRVLLCATCQHPITDRDQGIAMAGAFQHTFANPHGYIYRIGCFRAAPGCVTEAARTPVFSWFSGYAWSLTGCAMCGNHLGWQYIGTRDRFFGLVLDRLVEADRPEEPGRPG